MSDLRTIKKKLLRENKLDRVYEAMGCEYINYSGGRIEAQLPQRFNSDNKRGVQTKLNENLSSSIRNRADFGGGDIYSLVSYIHHDKRGDDIQADLYNAKTFICESLGWNEFLEGGSYKSRIDYVSPLRALMKDRRGHREVEPNPILPEQILDEFLPYPSYDWILEGISHQTQKMYHIGFDLESKRITIPMRNRFGQLVGVKGRIMKDEDDDRKYLYLYRYQNRLEWFNFHFAHPYILMDKRVYIFEAEKSPMKAFQNGIYNTLGIGASEISPEQAQMVKQLGLDIEIVFCYDKGITVEEIERNTELFKGRKILVMYDLDGLLKGKDSPIDEGIETWNRLLENNIYEIDELKNLSKSVDKHQKL